SRKIRTTMERLSANGLNPLQQAWIAKEVPQCGYCQTVQIMAAAALLAKTPQPSDDQITQAMNGNICRCGTYDRIRRAIHRAAGAGGARGVLQYQHQLRQKVPRSHAESLP